MGVIVGVHGVRGEVRVKVFTSEPEAIGAYGPLTDGSGIRSFKLKFLRQTKGVVIARIQGITDRDAAEALKGTELYTDRGSLPETEDDDTFYHADLVGLKAEDMDGNPVGQVVAVFDHGAGDVLDIRTIADGRLISLPFTREVVPVVDVAAGRLAVNMPEGLLASKDASGDSK
jgi:16S rRNA processing protein RimM